MSRYALMFVALIAAGCSAPSKVERIATSFDRLETLLGERGEAEKSGDADKARKKSGEISDVVNGMADDICWAVEFETDRRRALAAAVLGFARITDATRREDVLAALVIALKDQHPDVRCNAAGSLGRLGDAQTPLSPIADLLNDPAPQVRSAALYALFHLLPEGNDAGLYDRFLKQIDDSNAAVRNHALLALRKMGDPDAVRPIVENLVSDREPVIRENAALALGTLIGSDRYREMVKGLKKANTDPEKALPEKALLEKALAELDGRFAQLRAIANPPLIELLKDEIPAVVKAAAYALRQINIGEDHGRSYAYWRAWWEQQELRGSPTHRPTSEEPAPIKSDGQPKADPPTPPTVEPPGGEPHGGAPPAPPTE